MEETDLLEMDGDAAVLRGTNGVLRLRDDDEVARRLAMLFEGECEGLGPTAAAGKLGLTKQRYSQLLHLFEQQGAAGLEPHKRGPKGPSKRTEAVVRQIIRYRFLDPDASPDVIAQKLRQNGWPIAQRSVERVIAEFGLQKKLYAFRPDAVFVNTQRSNRKQRREPCDCVALERGVRQCLADKDSGTLGGLWLSIPEHLRLGTWDLPLGCSGRPAPSVEPRLALQLYSRA